VSGSERVGLLQAIQRRAAAGTPYLPVWLSAPVAWARPRVSTPRFDGSGRVVLSELRREGRP
jgi:peptide/nickel transport system substrate-binding protein